MFGWSYQHWPRRCGRLWVTMLPPRPNRCDHKMYTPYHLVYPTAQEELRMIPVDVPIKQCPRQLHQPLLFPLNPRLPLVAIFYETGVGTDNDDEIEIGTVASEAGVSSLSGSANTAVSVEAVGKGWDSTNEGVSSCGNVWGDTSLLAACSKV